MVVEILREFLFNLINQLLHVDLNPHGSHVLIVMVSTLRNSQDTTLYECVLQIYLCLVDPVAWVFTTRILFKILREINQLGIIVY